MSLRQYLEDNPEVVAQLHAGTLLAQDLAAQLGLSRARVSKVLSEMNLLINTGEVAAARKEASVARQERDVHLQELAQAVVAGRLNVDDAADQAGCSRDTIWRRVRKIRAEL